MNCSYTFFSTTCTKDFGLDWGDFAKFHKLLYSTVAMHEHVIAKFRNLLHFLDSWVIYKEKKAYPWWGHNTFHQLVWRLDQEEISIFELDSPSKETKQHVGFVSKRPCN